jgi:hypothetical protein
MGKRPPEETVILEGAVGVVEEEELGSLIEIVEELDPKEQATLSNSHGPEGRRRPGNPCN